LPSKVIVAALADEARASEHSDARTRIGMSRREFLDRAGDRTDGL
jgi:hypothetical protein